MVFKFCVGVLFIHNLIPCVYDLCECIALMNYAAVYLKMLLPWSGKILMIVVPLINFLFSISEFFFDACLLKPQKQCAVVIFMYVCFYSVHRCSIFNPWLVFLHYFQNCRKRRSACCVISLLQCGGL